MMNRMITELEYQELLAAENEYGEEWQAMEVALQHAELSIRQTKGKWIVWTGLGSQRISCSDESLPKALRSMASKIETCVICQGERLLGSWKCYNCDGLGVRPSLLNSR